MKISGVNYSSKIIIIN